MASGAAACRSAGQAGPRNCPPRPPAAARPWAAQALRAPARHADRGGVAHGRSPRDPILAPMVKLSEHDVTDLNTYLLRNRTIFLGSRITDETATRVVATLMALESLDPNADITMYINSPGGSPYATVAILDIFEAIKPEIRTVAFGQVSTTAALLLAAGTKGKRFSMPSTRIMLHQPFGGAQGSADEVNITTEELNRTMQLVNAFMSKFTGQSVETVEKESDRPSYMSPEQAVAFGILDAVLPPGRQ